MQLLFRGKALARIYALHDDDSFPNRAEQVCGCSSFRCMLWWAESYKISWKLLKGITKLLHFYRENQPPRNKLLEFIAQMSKWKRFRVTKWNGKYHYWSPGKYPEIFVFTLKHTFGSMSLNKLSVGFRSKHPEVAKAPHL